MSTTPAAVRRGRSYSDGQTVKVKAPTGTQIAEGDFVYLEGWFGLAEFETIPDINGEIGINVAQKEYVTSQVQGSAFNRGDEVFFDEGAGLLTAGAGDVGPVGKVTKALDGAGCIQFKLASQPFAGAGGPP